MDSAVSYAKRSAFEIGKRLIEAKELVPSGEWIAYLRDTLDYSVDTAENLMRISREFDITAVPQFGELNYGQMVAMFTLPAPERKEFVESQNISGMSVREIKKLIKEKEAAEQAAKEAKQASDEREKTIDGLRSELLTAQQTVSKNAAELADMERLKQEAEENKKQVGELKADIARERKKVAELKANPEKVEVQVNEPTPERLEELRAEATRDAEVRIRAEYDAKIEERVREAVGQAEREKAMEDPRFVEINVALTQIQNLMMCVGTNFNQLRDEGFPKIEVLSEKLESFFDKMLEAMKIRLD